MNLRQSNGQSFAVDKICRFSLLDRESWSGTLPHFFRSYEKRCQKSTRRVCAPSRLPWGWGTICTFFACTKKVPKKYTEGLRALLTPGDAVKFLRFDGDTGNFTVCGNARKRGFSLLFSDMGLTQAEF